MCVFACSWTCVANLMHSRLTTCWAQSFTRPNSTSTACRVKGPLMSAFQEISVVGLPNTWSHVAVEVFKGNFWVIVMSSRRQQRCGCSRHGAQLSASTCRNRSWLYRVALSGGTLAVPPLCFLLYVLYFLIMRVGGGGGLEALCKKFTSLNCPFSYFSFCSFCQMNMRFGPGPDWSRSLNNNCSQPSQCAALQMERFRLSRISSFE